MEKKKEFVKLVSVYGPAEAEIIKAKLEAEGIKVFLKAEALRGIYGLHLDGLGRVEIWVPKTKKKEAQTLLNQD